MIICYRFVEDWLQAIRVFLHIKAWIRMAQSNYQRFYHREKVFMYLTKGWKYIRYQQYKKCMSYKQKILMIRNIMKLNKESCCTLIRKLHPYIAPFPVRIFLLLVSLPLRCQGIPVAAMHVIHHPKYPRPACTFQALPWSGLPLGERKFLPTVKK